MTEQKGTFTEIHPQEARQHHQPRLVLAVLTVFRELSAGHVVANKDW